MLVPTDRFACSSGGSLGKKNFFQFFVCYVIEDVVKFSVVVTKGGEAIGSRNDSGDINVIF